MVNEHVLTFEDALTSENLSYMAKKANQLGLKGRKIMRVYSQTDEEGTHIYYTVEAMKEKSHGMDKLE